ncbi:MAG: hypothetical protein Q4B54_01830, partial [Coriobacteriales bacterium]|nr:hypothetical protein [Coriobacteriales bacterium]
MAKEHKSDGTLSIPDFLMNPSSQLKLELDPQPAEEPAPTNEPDSLPLENGDETAVAEPTPEAIVEPEPEPEPEP